MKNPELWNGWETIGPLGDGGFAEVFQIRKVDESGVYESAVKKISIPKNNKEIHSMELSGYTREEIIANFEERKNRIISEFRIMESLSGESHIVNYQDHKIIEHEDGIGCDILIKMELLDPLDKYCCLNGIKEKDVLEIGKNICDALILCHNSNPKIIHRDIKPSNIFVNKRGKYKLGDFGIAKNFDKTISATSIGTPNYMAPEVKSGKKYNQSVDIYSLGMVLYWLLNERRFPFLPSRTEEVTINESKLIEAETKRLMGEEIPLPKYGSEKLQSIVMRAVKFNPEDRYDSAQEMFDELNEVNTADMNDKFLIESSISAAELNDYLKEEDSNLLTGFVPSGKTGKEILNSTESEIMQTGKKSSISFNVSFITDDGTTISSKRIIEGRTIEKPETPVKKGYLFKWWENQKTKKPFDFNTKITEDINLIAKYRKPFSKYLIIIPSLLVIAAGVIITLLLFRNGKVLVHFDANGGKCSVNEKYYVINQEIDELPVPEIEDRDFLGWYYGDNIVTVETFIPKEETTLKAHYSELNFINVSFDPNGGETEETDRKVQVSIGLGELKDAKKEGFVFTGWYDEPEKGNRFTADTELPHEDIVLYAQYIKKTDDVKTVVLSLNANGGSCLKKELSYISGTQIGGLPTPTRARYNFIGWYTDPSSGREVFSSTVINENMTVYAHWAEYKKITINFDSCEGNCSTSSKEITEKDSIGTLPTASRLGYQFIGWFTEKQYGTKISESTKFSSSTVLYAHYKQKDMITVTFDANGGKVSTKSISATPDLPLNCSLPTPTRNGYNFVGWYTSQTGGNQINNSTVAASTDTTYYAHWEEIRKITITFNANGGSANITEKTIYEKTSLGTLPVAAKKSYNFVGWYTDPNVGTLVSETTIFENNTTIYARYSEKALITVTFNANGGTASFSSVKVIPEQQYGDIFPEVEKEGNIFDGWYTSQTGGNPVNNLSVAGTSDVTQYAHWTARQKVTITFNANGGKTNISSKQCYVNDCIGSLPIATKTGNNFYGWYTSQIGGTQVDETYVVQNAQVLYARFSTKDPIFITLNANGAPVETRAVSVTPELEIGELYTPSWSGHIFKGWYTSQTGGTLVDSHTVAGTSNITYFAHWEVIQKITITFDACGGNVSETSREIYKGTSLGTLPGAAKVGKNFMGWYTENTFANKVSESTIFNENKTLYAYYSTKAPITVTFNANGGSVSFNTRNATPEMPYGDIFPTATKSGHIFDGWYTAATNGTEVNQLTIAGENNVTIYAHWREKDRITITFNACGGTVNPSSVSIYAEDEIGSLPTPTKAGHIFTDWYTSESGGNKISSQSAFTQNTTVYARYTLKSDITIYFNGNGGTASQTSKGYTPELPIGNDLPTASWNGYSFTGWYTSQMGGTKIESSYIVPSSSITCYARWSLMEYTATWNSGTGYSITVTRGSSPLAGASIGAISSGSKIYYGDTLSVSYTTGSGYELTNNGITNITVSGNITASDIYATVQGIDATYKIVCVSSNGASLGNSTITKKFGTTNNIVPSAITGYKTPSSQNVAWDQIQEKTITFTYQPLSAENQVTLSEGVISYTDSTHTVPNLLYCVEFEYRNRTETTVQIRFKWTDICPANYYFEHWQKFRVTVAGNTTAWYQIASSSTFNRRPNGGPERSAYAYSDWITVNTSASANSVNITLQYMDHTDQVSQTIQGVDHVTIPCW